MLFRSVEALLRAEALPWHDQDKKGRPRQRDCRPYLRDLRIKAAAPLDGMAGAGTVEMVLEAMIDPQGRSLRPEQLVSWLAERLPCPLRLGSVRREQLRLRAC